MVPVWKESALKRGISPARQTWVILHPTYRREVPDATPERGGRVVLFTGLGRELDEQELEILVRVFADGRQAEVFHAMHVTERLRQYREEHPDGWVR